MPAQPKFGRNTDPHGEKRESVVNAITQKIAARLTSKISSARLSIAALASVEGEGTEAEELTKAALVTKHNVSIKRWEAELGALNPGAVVTDDQRAASGAFGSVVADIVATVQIPRVVSVSVNGYELGGAMAGQLATMATMDSATFDSVESYMSAQSALLAQMIEGLKIAQLVTEVHGADGVAKRETPAFPTDDLAAALAFQKSEKTDKSSSKSSSK